MSDHEGLKRMFWLETVCLACLVLGQLVMTQSVLRATQQVRDNRQKIESVQSILEGRTERFERIERALQEIKDQP